MQDLVEPILAKGANPTAVNGVGICALHYTCYAESLSFDAAEALLWRGADPSAAETTYGCTPLHYAASAGDADLCALLVEHGAESKASGAVLPYLCVYTELTGLCGSCCCGREEWPTVCIHFVRREICTCAPLALAAVVDMVWFHHQIVVRLRLLVNHDTVSDLALLLIFGIVVIKNKN